MVKLRVEYFLDRCVGNKKCLYNDPSSFSFSKGKAALRGSEKEGDIFAVIKDCDGRSLDNLINAAKSCPVNAIRIVDFKTKKDVVSSTVTLGKNFREIKAEYDDGKEFVLDPLGYFLIKVDTKKKLIEVGFCKSRNVVEIKIVGKKAIDIYQTIIREKIIARPDHAAYIGRELAKAEIALENNLEYVQDDALKIKKS